MAENDNTNELLAINICFLPEPSSEFSIRSLELNQKINEINSESFKFSETREPHLTIVQAFIKTNQLSVIINTINNQLSQLSSCLPVLKSAGIVSGPNFDGNYSPQIKFELDENLIKFHQKLIEIIRPFRIITAEEEGTENSSVIKNSFFTVDGDFASSSTIDWVNNFESKNALENYNPHITLGSADQKNIEEICQWPVTSSEWNPRELFIYQLGNKGVVRKELARISL